MIWMHGEFVICNNNDTACTQWMTWMSMCNACLFLLLLPYSGIHNEYKGPCSSSGNLYITKIQTREKKKKQKTNHKQWLYKSTLTSLPFPQISTFFNEWDNLANLSLASCTWLLNASFTQFCLTINESYFDSGLFL